MKTINFLNTLSAQERNQLKQWYQISIGMLCTFILIVAYLQGQQLYTLYTIKTDHTQLQDKVSALNALAQRTAKLKAQQEEIAAKQKKIARYAGSAAGSNYLKQLLQAVGTADQIESISIEKQHTQISLFCPNTDKTTHTIQALQKTGLFNTVKLQSLQPQQKNNKTVLRVCLQGVKKIV